jgi:hypothetical protein
MSNMAGIRKNTSGKLWTCETDYLTNLEKDMMEQDKLLKKRYVAKRRGRPKKVITPYLVKKQSEFILDFD